VNFLLRPAVGLMNRLRYPRKFLLISLLFAAPLWLTLYLWLDELHERIAFAEKERAGVEYVAAVDRLIEHILLGRADGVAAAAEAVDALDRRLGSELQTRQLWARVRGAALEAGAPPVERSLAALDLIAHAGDISNLILDPDLDSYYLMEAVVMRLPELAIQLGAVAAAGGPAERIARVGVVRALRHAIERGHAVAFLPRSDRRSSPGSPSSPGASRRWPRATRRPPPRRAR
jgi:hypothetical protein